MDILGISIQYPKEMLVSLIIFGVYVPASVYYIWRMHKEILALKAKLKGKR